MKSLPHPRSSPRPSAKVRSGDPEDDPADLVSDIGAGTVPIRLVAGAPVPAQNLPAGVSPPPSAVAVRHRSAQSGLQLEIVRRARGKTVEPSSLRSSRSDFGEEAVPEGCTHGHFPVGIFSVDGIQVATHCVAAKQTPSIEWGRHADIRS